LLSELRAALDDAENANEVIAAIDAFEEMSDDQRLWLEEIRVELAKAIGTLVRLIAEAEG
jgi:hypothetical protein